jgi:hypothetical protein
VAPFEAMARASAVFGESDSSGPDIHLEVPGSAPDVIDRTFWLKHMQMRSHAWRFSHCLFTEHAI